jgi:type IV pilus assembly protein PilV
MHLRLMKSSPTIRRQSGASLIEVLVAILLLSFGMLSLGAMLSFAVQMPKLSGYRATAVNLASSHIERMRANPGQLGDYDQSSYDGTFVDIALNDCDYPTCNESSLAAMDNAATQRAARHELPAGGIVMRRDDTSGTVSTTVGNLWIVWQEPSTYAALNPSTSDNCPLEITGTYTNPRPRCLYVRFKL